MTKEQKIILKINELNFLLTGEAKEKYSPVLQEVLDMLKEKDEKIEYYRKQKDYDMQFRHELLEKIRCLSLDKDEKDAEIEKKDKQMDLMADFMIGGLEDIAFKAICKKSNCVYELKDNRPTKCRKCKDCIKQYFKRKAKLC